MQEIRSKSAASSPLSDKVSETTLPEVKDYLIHVIGAVEEQAESLHNLSQKTARTSHAQAENVAAEIKELRAVKDELNEMQRYFLKQKSRVNLTPGLWWKLPAAAVASALLTAAFLYALVKYL